MSATHPRESVCLLVSLFAGSMIMPGVAAAQNAFGECTCTPDLPDPLTIIVEDCACVLGGSSLFQDNSGTSREARTIGAVYGPDASGNGKILFQGFASFLTILEVSANGVVSPSPLDTTQGLEISGTLDFSNCTASGTASFNGEAYGTWSLDRDPEYCGEHACRIATWDSFSSTEPFSEVSLWSYEDASVSEVPSENDVALFNNGSQTTVTFSTDVTNDRLELEASTGIELQLGGFLYELTGACDDSGSGSSIVLGNVSSGADNLFIENGRVLADGVTLSADVFTDSTLTVSTGASVVVNSMRVGLASEATLVVVSGGSLSTLDGATVRGGAGVSGAGSSWTAGASVVIGASNDGSLLVEDSGEVQFGQVTVAENAGSTSTATIQGGAIATFSDFLVVGEEGNGTMTLASGAELTTAGVCSIAAEQFSQGSATITGEDTSWVAEDTINVGFGGEGSLLIELGATVNASVAILGNVENGRGSVEVATGSLWLVEGAVQVGLGGSGIITVDADATLSADLVGVSSLGTIGTATIYIGDASTGSNEKATVSAQQTSDGRNGIITRSLIVDEGATLNVDEVVFEDGGQVGGTGTLTFDVTNTGSLTPGGAESGVGTFTIDGDYVQSGDATLDIELGGTVAGSDYDVLTVSGAATLAGVLNVSLIGDFAPRSGDRFTVANYATRDGVFSSITNPDGFSFEAEYGGTSLTLIATALQPSAGGGLCGAMGMIPLLLMAMTLSGYRAIMWRNSLR